jgi:hypothetical protein
VLAKNGIFESKGGTIYDVAEMSAQARKSQFKVQQPQGTIKVVKINILFGFKLTAWQERLQKPIDIDMALLVERHLQQQQNLVAPCCVTPHDTQIGLVLPNLAARHRATRRNTKITVRVNRGPFLTSPLGVNLSLRGEFCPLGVKVTPGG